MNERMLDAELCGFLSYCAIATHGRIVKDAYMAPDTGQLLDLLQQSQQTMEVIDALNDYSAQAGYDIHALMEPAVGLYAELESRLRPANWAERIVKTYVAFGMLDDCVQILLENEDFPVAEAVRNAHWLMGYTTWARRMIKIYAQADEQMAQRLSLWGRRVFGEGLGLVRSLAARYPDVAELIAAAAKSTVGSNAGSTAASAVDNTVESTIVEFVQQRHGQRMADCGLDG